MREDQGKVPGGGPVARRRGMSGKMGELRPGTGARTSSERKYCYFRMLKMQEGAKFYLLRQNQLKRCFRGSFVDTSGSFLDKKNEPEITV